MSDDELRAACFLALDVLQARFGHDVPYEALRHGFDFRGGPTVTNGLSLCSIHHRAFDEDLVGVSPDLRVHVHRRLLDDEDGPMLDVLKAFDGASLAAPAKKLWRPDPERLAARFERFTGAA